MKRTNRLTLNRETLRTLQAGQLRRAVGGTDPVTERYCYDGRGTDTGLCEPGEDTILKPPSGLPGCRSYGPCDTRDCR